MRLAPRKDEEPETLEFASLAPWVVLVSTFQSVSSGKDLSILSGKQAPDALGSLLHLLPVGGD